MNNEPRFAAFVGVPDDEITAIDQFKKLVARYPRIKFTGPHRRHLSADESTQFYIEGPDSQFFDLMSDLGYSHEDFDTLYIVELRKE